MHAMMMAVGMMMMIAVGMMTMVVIGDDNTSC